MGFKTTIIIFAAGVLIGTCISKGFDDKKDNKDYKDNKNKGISIPFGYVSGDTLKTEKEKSYQEGKTVGYTSGKTDGYNVGYSEGYKKCEEEITITIDKRRAESEKSNKNQVLFNVKQ